MPIVLCMYKKDQKHPLSDQHTSKGRPVQNLVYENSNVELEGHSFMEYP